MDYTIYCPRCGKAMAVESVHLSSALQCPHCQHIFSPSLYTGPNPVPNPTGAAPPTFPLTTTQPLKSKIVAGLLGIFLGGLGVHRFYLGYYGIGVVQILVTLLTCGAGSVWGLIEGILCLVGKMTDADGRPLVD